MGTFDFNEEGSWSFFYAKPYDEVMSDGKPPFEKTHELEKADYIKENPH